MTNELPSSHQPGDIRSQARERAQQARAQQKRRDRRNRYLLMGGVGVALVAVGATVVMALVSSIPRQTNGPLNMLSDGIRIGADFEVERTLALRPEAQPVASVPSDDPDVVDIRLYVDYLCPVCAEFEETNRQQIRTWIESGAATLEVHPLSLFDRVSHGGQYSTRAANAAACVANYQPESFFDFNTLLFQHQPETNTVGLDDERLTELARQAGAGTDAVATCIEEVRFKKWVREATSRAFEGPLPHADIEQVTRTPTIIVNGLTYTGARDDATEFAKFVSTASGTAFVEELKASSTPSPSPSPEPESAPTAE